MILFSASLIAFCFLSYLILLGFLGAGSLFAAASLYALGVAQPKAQDGLSSLKNFMHASTNDGTSPQWAASKSMNISILARPFTASIAPLPVGVPARDIECVR